MCVKLALWESNIKGGLENINLSMNVVIECRRFTKYVDTFSPFTIAFSFSTNEAKEIYFYQKVNLRVASQVAERLKTGSQKIGKL